MTLASIARDYLEALGQINFELSRAQKFAFSHTKYLPKDAACIKKVDIQKWLAGKACKKSIFAREISKDPAQQNRSIFRGGGGSDAFKGQRAA